MDPMAKRNAKRRSIVSKEAHMRLAQEYFRAATEAKRMEDMLKDRVVELVGAIDRHMVSFDVDEQEVEIHNFTKMSTLGVTPESQQKIYELGFKRISVLNHKGWETYYYTGGDVRGYTKQERAVAD
jgi:hypothetical protein